MLGKNLKDAVTNVCAVAAMVGGLLTIGGQNNLLPRKCLDAGIALVSGAGVITSFCTGKSSNLSANRGDGDGE